MPCAVQTACAATRLQIFQYSTMLFIVLPSNNFSFRLGNDIFRLGNDITGITCRCTPISIGARPKKSLKIPEDNAFPGELAFRSKGEH